MFQISFVVFCLVLSEIGGHDLNETCHEVPLLDPWEGMGENIGLTEEQKCDCLQAHNTFRSSIYAHAANEHVMIWDSYLAEMAYNYSLLCDFSHGQAYQDTWTDETIKYKKVGQNLFFYNGTHEGLNGNCTAMVQSWRDEEKNWDYQQAKCLQGQCYHFTQVMWATTTQVGCAMSRCPILKESAAGIDVKAIDADYLVCNYYPMGNVVGQNPYIDGEECSRCPEGGFWCTDEGQCATKEHIKAFIQGQVNLRCHEVQCANGGTFNKNTCRCECVHTDDVEWHGIRCDKRCGYLRSRCYGYDHVSDRTRYPQYAAWLMAYCGMRYGWCHELD